MRNGFSLVELLISLAILALIAVHTIPKILIAQENQQNSAVLKETFATLSTVLYQSRLMGEITENTSLSDLSELLKQKLNYARFCDSGSNSDGCEQYAITPDVDIASKERFIFHTGSYLYINGKNHAGGINFVFFIDPNGKNGPSLDQHGEILALWFNPSSEIQTVSGRYENLKPGQLTGDLLAGSGRIELYEETFQ